MVRGTLGGPEERWDKSIFEIDQSLASKALRFYDKIRNPQKFHFVMYTVQTDH